MKTSTAADAAYHDARVRVRYAETDQMGVVYHANYLIWFEVGRVELMRSLGFDYKQMEADNCRIAVIEASARYRLPARYDDSLLVRTRVTAQRSFLIKFRYEVLREPDGQLLCEGETSHIVCDAEMKKRTLPEKYAERFRTLGI
jgi:acyl-CoA thioester hydrolase